MKRRIRQVFVLATVALLALQLVPVDWGPPGPPLTFRPPPGVEAYLQRACYDCHSSRVRWPWAAG